MSIFISLFQNCIAPASPAFRLHSYHHDHYALYHPVGSFLVSSGKGYRQGKLHQLPLQCPGIKLSLILWHFDLYDPKSTSLSFLILSVLLSHGHEPCDTTLLHLFNSNSRSASEDGRLSSAE